MRLKGAGIPVALGYGVDDLAVLYSPIHSKYCVVDDYMWSWTVLSTGTPPPSFPTISYGMGLRAADIEAADYASFVSSIKYVDDVARFRNRHLRRLFRQQSYEALCSCIPSFSRDAERLGEGSVLAQE